MIPLSLNTATRFGINVVVFLAGIVALRLGQIVFVPTILALLLTAVLFPAAYWLHSTLKLRWSLACITVIFGLLMLNLVIFFILMTSVTRIAQQMPRNESELLDTYRQARAKMATLVMEGWELDPDLFPIEPQYVNDIGVFQYFTNAGTEILRNSAPYAGNWLFQWILILFLLLFLLLEGRMLSRRVVEIFGPSLETQAQVGAVLSDIARSVRTYLVWRTIINFALALVVGIIYEVAGLRQAWTWAILLAILNYIPYLGPLIALVPPVLDALWSTSVVTAVGITFVYAAIIIMEGYLIVPLLMGRSMDLNATTVMLACLFWDLVWGWGGLFLAMPIMAAVKAICFHVPGWRPWANLMSTSDEPALPVVMTPVPVVAASVLHSHETDPSNLTQIGS